VEQERVEALTAEKSALEERLALVERANRGLRRRARHPALRLLLSWPVLVGLAIALFASGVVASRYERQRLRAEFERAAEECGSW
jgi:hypothetical protein